MNKPQGRRPSPRGGAEAVSYTHLFYRKEQTVATMMDDAVFCLLALLILPVVFYGARPLLTALVSCGACFLAMVAFRLIHRRNISLSERSLFVTGLTVALLLPADVPYWLAALGGAFAIFVAKEPFGSTGRNPLNPAAAGVAFVTVLWPEEVSRFPAVGSLPLWGRGAEASLAPVSYTHLDVYKRQFFILCLRIASCGFCRKCE